MSARYSGVVKRWLSEFLGTGLIVAAVIGSAYMASALTDDLLLHLLVNAVATVLTLVVVISIFGSISGAHFNPVVTLVLAFEGKFSRGAIMQYITAQLLGGIFGAILANLMFINKAIELAEKNRSFATHYLGELIATSVLVLIILLALHQGKESSVPHLVPAWIGSAYFLTVSTSFANPAVTVARSFTNNFSGINLQSTLIFIVVQLLGGILGLALARLLTRK